MKRILSVCLLFLLAGCASQSMPGGDDAITVALLDTGISTAVIPQGNVLPGWNYINEDTDTQDRMDHGTAVASVILGCDCAGVKALAPEAYLVPMVIVDKAEGETRSVTPEVLAQAIRDSADKYGARIINVSLGIKEDVPALREAVAYVLKKGVLVIAAAGNDGNGDMYYPAAYEDVLAVGSHDKRMTISSFTQRNGMVDLLAPGEDILLASRHGRPYGIRGTSFAAAHVTAAAAALWAEFPDLTAQQVIERLLDSSRSAENIPILQNPN